MKSLLWVLPGLFLLGLGMLIAWLAPSNSNASAGGFTVAYLGIIALAISYLLRRRWIRVKAQENAFVLEGVVERVYVHRVHQFAYAWFRVNGVSIELDSPHSYEALKEVEEGDWIELVYYEYPVGNFRLLRLETQAEPLLQDAVFV